jgi:signal transduction histidine kinase
VTVSNDERWLRFVVSDDGVGSSVAHPDGPAPQGGQGVINMTDRIGALGGTLSFGSGPDGGTEVIGQVPLAPDVGSPWSAAGPASAR